MGIKGLTNLFQQYYNEVLHCKTKFMQSDTYYLDYTSKIYLTVRWYVKQLNLDKLKLSDYGKVLEDLLELLAREIVEHIESHMFYKQYIMCFDFKRQAKSSISTEYNLDDDTYQKELEKFDERDWKYSNVVIPNKIYNTIKENNLKLDTEDLKKFTAMVFHVSWHYWAPHNNLSLYRNFKSLIDEGLIDEQTYNEVDKYHKTAFIIERKTKKKISGLIYEENLKKLQFAENLEYELKKILFDFRPQMIIGLLPNLVHRIKTKLQKSKCKDIYLEILGCNTEADYVIRKHIKTYSPTYNEKNKPNHYSVNKPTIFTIDTDLLVMLADVDCVVNLKMKKIPKINCSVIPINLKQFWTWVMKTDKYTIADIESKFNVKIPISNNQANQLETDFFYIESDPVLNTNLCLRTNSNVFTNIFI
jgi:hypothetical protein